MSEPRKTPWTEGPWSYRLNSHETAFIIENAALAKTDWFVTYLSWWTHGKPPAPTRAISEANARLIAAAPSLAGALRKAVLPRARETGVQTQRKGEQDMSEITDEAVDAALDAFHGRLNWINNIRKPGMRADMTRALTAAIPHLRPAAEAPTDLRQAAEALRDAAHGFQRAIAGATGKPYPWPALDLAYDALAAALPRRRSTGKTRRVRIALAELADGAECEGRVIGTYFRPSVEAAWQSLAADHYVTRLAIIEADIPIHPVLTVPGVVKGAGE